MALLGAVVGQPGAADGDAHRHGSGTGPSGDGADVYARMVAALAAHRDGLESGVRSRMQHLGLLLLRVLGDGSLAWLDSAASASMNLVKAGGKPAPERPYWRPYTVVRDGCHEADFDGV